MKLTKLFIVPFLFAAVVAAAKDGGPQTGGNLSTNPNGRPPRSESGVADGGPMSGTSSTNPNGRTPMTADTTAPAAPGTPATSAPPATATTTTRPPPALPPMSGGNWSTNPNRTPTPPPVLPATTAPPVPSTTASANDGGGGDEAITSAPEPSQQSGESIDFSLINHDASYASDLIGEVQPDEDATGSGFFVSESNSTATHSNGEDETANDADNGGSSANEARPETPPDATNEKNVSTAELMSSARRSANACGWSTTALVGVAVAALMACVEF